MFQNALRDPQHGGVLAAQQLIRIDHHADPSVPELPLRHLGIGARHHDQRDKGKLPRLPIAFTEGEHLVRGLRLAVDQDGIRPSLDISAGSAQSFLLSVSQDEALTAGGDHEIPGNPSPLSHGYLFAHDLDLLLRL